MKLLREYLFPPRCVACCSLITKKNGEYPYLCTECMSQWKREAQERCDICGKLAGDCLCGTAMTDEVSCRGVVKLCYYRHARRDYVQNKMIFRIKQERNRRLETFLCHELGDALLLHLRENGIFPKDCLLTYIPRAVGAKMKYGTDQAKMLAEGMSEYTKIPVRNLLCRRTAIGKKQKKLTAAARRKNAKEAYTLCKNADAMGKTVILVDDILTTGATLSTGIQLLRRAGGKQIFAAVVASDDINQQRHEEAKLSFGTYKG